MDTLNELLKYMTTLWTLGYQSIASLIAHQTVEGQPMLLTTKEMHLRNPKQVKARHLTALQRLNHILNHSPEEPTPPLPPLTHAPLPLKKRTIHPILLKALNLEPPPLSNPWTKAAQVPHQTPTLWTCPPKRQKKMETNHSWAEPLPDITPPCLHCNQHTMGPSPCNVCLICKQKAIHQSCQHHGNIPYSLYICPTCPTTDPPPEVWDTVNQKYQATRAIPKRERPRQTAGPNTGQLFPCDATKAYKPSTPQQLKEYFLNPASPADPYLITLIYDDQSIPAKIHSSTISSKTCTCKGNCSNPLHTKQMREITWEPCYIFPHHLDTYNRLGYSTTTIETHSTPLPTGTIPGTLNQLIHEQNPIHKVTWAPSLVEEAQMHSTFGTQWTKLTQEYEATQQITPAPPLDPRIMTALTLTPAQRQGNWGPEQDTTRSIYPSLKDQCTICIQSFNPCKDIHPTGEITLQYTTHHQHPLLQPIHPPPIASIDVYNQQGQYQASIDPDLTNRVQEWATLNPSPTPTPHHLLHLIKYYLTSKHPTHHPFPAPLLQAITNTLGTPHQPVSHFTHKGTTLSTLTHILTPPTIATPLTHYWTQEPWEGICAIRPPHNKEMTLLCLNWALGTATTRNTPTLIFFMTSAHGQLAIHMEHPMIHHLMTLQADQGTDPTPISEKGYLPPPKDSPNTRASTLSATSWGTKP